MELTKMNAETAASLLPLRFPDSHKGSYGTLLAAVGSKNMTGAAILSCRAAYKSGCGLVIAAMPQEAVLPLQLAVPEAIAAPYGEDAELSVPGRVSAILCGPGISVSPTSCRLLEKLLDEEYSHLPLLLDADALNLIALHPALGEKLTKRGHSLITPHLGEAARLLQTDVAGVREMGTEAALLLAEKYNTVCLLKLVPAVCVEPSGRGTVNSTGNHGMATAGSGDVLAGAAGGLLAQGLSPLAAASAAAYYHGEAGDRAARRLGYAGLMASDICSELRMDKPPVSGVF